MNDYFVYYSCVNGHCPLIIEEERYGVRTSTCEDYCGGDFKGCEYCCLEGAEECNNCIHMKR